MHVVTIKPIFPTIIPFKTFQQSSLPFHHNHHQNSSVTKILNQFIKITVHCREEKRRQEIPVSPPLSNKYNFPSQFPPLGMMEKFTEERQPFIHLLHLLPKPFFFQGLRSSRTNQPYHKPPHNLT